MKHPRLILSLLVCANGMLAGCASTSNGVGGESNLGPGVDEKRVAAVEAAAHRAFVDVHWVNYPHKPGQ